MPRSHRESAALNEHVELDPAKTAPDVLVPGLPPSWQELVVALTPILTAVLTILSPGVDVSLRVKAIVGTVGTALTGVYGLYRMYLHVVRARERSKVARAQLEATAGADEPWLTDDELEQLVLRIVDRLGPTAKKALASGRPRR